MSVSLTCACGTTAWTLDTSRPGRHVVCHCIDCQSHMRHLGHPELFASHNGSHLWQTTPDALTLTRGHETFSCLRLSPKGLLRWYAGCCNTPIANTLPKPTLPFVGVVIPAQSAEQIGPVQGVAFTDSTQGAVKPYGFAMAGLTIMLRALGAKLTGKTSDLFFTPDGQPSRTPEVLSLDARRAAAQG